MNAHYDEVLGLVRWQRRGVECTDADVVTDDAYSDELRVTALPSTAPVATTVLVEDDALDPLDDVLTLEPSAAVLEALSSRSHSISPTAFTPPPVNLDINIAAADDKAATLDRPAVALDNSHTALNEIKFAQPAMSTLANPRTNIPVLIVSQDGRFSGEVAKLLTAMLSAIKFQRADVTTAALVSSPGVTLLTDKLAEVKPAMMLVFGDAAAQAILNSQSTIAVLRNKIHFYGNDNIPLVATYHPASLLKNAAEKRPAWEDLCLLRQHYDSII